MISDNETPLMEMLKLIAERLDADAVGIAVIQADGHTGYATIVAHDRDDKPAPELFSRLSDELYKCALQAASAATHKDPRAS
jgi:hypothetical protein